MRLIDADELKEWIKNWLYKDSYYFPRRRKETIPASELYDVIDQVPTVQAYQTVQDVTITGAVGWHYLPELPEESDYYMITWEGIIGERYVSIAWYDAEENHFIDTCYREDYYKVIAWTESPEPAKGTKNDRIQKVFHSRYE